MLKTTPFTGSLGVDERLKLKINGKPVVYENSVFKLCDSKECEGVDLKLRTSGTRTLVGGNMTVVLSSDESRCFVHFG